MASLTHVNNFHSLEIMDSMREANLQVGEHFNFAMEGFMQYWKG